MKSFTKIIREEVHNNTQLSSPALDYINNNDLLTHLATFCINYPLYMELLLTHFSYIIREAKFCPPLIETNPKLISQMVTLILFLESEMKKHSLSFKYINEFALYLNEITRILPNFPTLVSSFRLNRQNEYSGIMCSDHIVFSNLLYLLELDHLIPRANFEYMKYIRRSLIVYLSFDEVNDSNYL